MDTSSIWGNDNKSSNSKPSNTSYPLNNTKEYSSQNEWGDFSDYSFSTPKESANTSDLDFFQSSTQYNLNSSISHNEWSDVNSTDKAFEDVTSNVWSNHTTPPAIEKTEFEIKEAVYSDNEHKTDTKPIETQNNFEFLPQSSSPQNIHQTSFQEQISFQENNIDKSISAHTTSKLEVVDTNFQIEDEFEDEFSDFTKPQLDFMPSKFDSLDFYTQSTPKSEKSPEKSTSHEKDINEEEEFDEFQDFTNEEYNLQADWDTHVSSIKQPSIKKSAKIDLLNQLNSISSNDGSNTETKNTITCVEEVYPDLDITKYNIQSVNFSEVNSSKDQNTRKLVEKISESKHNSSIFNWNSSSINKKYLSSFGLTPMIIERRQKPNPAQPHKVWGFGSSPLNARHRKSPSSKNDFQFEEASFINQHPPIQPTKTKSSILQMDSLLNDFEPATLTQSPDNTFFSTSNTLESMKPQSPTNSITNPIPTIKVANSAKPQSDNLIQGFDFSPSSSPKQLLSSFPPLIPPPP